MFGELVAAYLFLAGTGAGGIGAAALADLVAVRIPFGAAAVGAVADGRPADRLVAFALAASVAALALGSACLMADLGRADRVLALFLAPTFTLMNGGAWALAALLSVGTALGLARFMYLPWVGRRVVAALEVVAVILAAVVAVYAGLLLQMLPGVRLWSPLWVPVLFTLSAASCGCALLMAAALFVEADETAASLVRGALAVDAALIAGEVLAAVLFLGGALGGDHPGVAASVESLLHGPAALPWWCGFVACGLLAPLVAEVALGLRRRRRRSPAAPAPAPVGPVALAVLAALVLVGGAGLRWALVEAGEQRPLELQAPGPSAAFTAALADVEAAATEHAAVRTASLPEAREEREEPIPWSH